MQMKKIKDADLATSTTNRLFDVVVLSNIWGMSILFAPDVVLHGLNFGVVLTILYLEAVSSSYFGISGLPWFLILCGFFSLFGFILTRLLSKLSEADLKKVRRWGWYLLFIGYIVLFVLHLIFGGCSNE